MNWKTMPLAHKIATVISWIAVVVWLIGNLKPDLFPIDLTYPAVAVFTLCEAVVYWEKAAYEEAEHAAKFAELLGEDLEANMKADTKANLAWRVDCEYGATNGKFELAKVAKMNNLDAIHDTVHEMARDEARHGKALEGLLKRYFK